MEFQDQVLSFCRDRELLAPGDQVICALSGGADSMALLWSLVLLREKLELDLSAAHFNHGLRGAESDRDEAFVRDFCRGHSIPLQVGRGQVRACGRGLEDAARQARYRFLESLDPDAKIATAHTADDNAETVLLHLLRGTGLKGLGGIAPRRGRLIRPLLSLTRQEVEAFLSRWNIPHVEDSTNGEDGFLRNRLRSQVMTPLRRENPRFSPNVSRMAFSLRQDEDCLSTLARQALQEWSREGGLDCRGVAQLHPAIRDRVLGDFLRRCGVREPEASHIRAVAELLESISPSARVNLPGGVVLGRQYGLLVSCAPMPEWEPVLLRIPGETRVPAWKVCCQFRENFQKNQNKPFTFGISCDRIDPSYLTLRTRLPGDRMGLPGGHKSLKRILIDRKIPAAQRDSLPVIAAGDAVLAVAGVGVNLDYEAKPGAPALVIELEKIG